MSLVTANDLLNAAMKEKGLTQAQTAQLVGMVPQQLNAMMKRSSLRADLLIKILDALGVEIALMNKQTGEEVHLLGHGRRIRQMVNHITYDTSKSSALSNSFYADGVNEYNKEGKATELYMDDKGRYFFAEYTNWKDGKDRIVPVDGEVAAEFIKIHGTGVRK